jgi:hypothetical protein
VQDVVRTRPEIASAVRRLSLRDQLELTLELLEDEGDGDGEQDREPPPNVIPFRPRRR